MKEDNLHQDIVYNPDYLHDKFEMSNPPAVFGLVKH